MQVSTLSLFRFPRTEVRWMLTQMRQAQSELKAASGLEFSRLMGSGARNGFGLRPDFSVYAFLGVWKSEAHAKRFLEEGDFPTAAKAKSLEHCTLFMHAVKSHGTWGGQAPFETSESYRGGPIAVITRATLKWWRIPAFWSRVRNVSDSLEGMEGRRLSIGIGEYPVFMQATFSLWDDLESMRSYAYRNKFHTEVIRKTRELKWYKEELFANFLPYRSEGTWEGRALLDE